MLVDTSMNGVYVNGEKVPQKMPRQLCSKDEISLAFERNKGEFRLEIVVWQQVHRV